MKRRMIIGAAMGLPTLLLVVVLGVSTASAPTQKAPTPRALRMFPSVPVAGKMMPLDDAKALSPQVGLPLLPTTPLQEACSGKTATLELLAVWGPPEQVPLDQRQFGMNYSGGIWVSVSPLSGYDESIQKAGEFPPVEQAFSKDDYPYGLFTGEVRGHTAWVKGLSPDFSCVSTVVQAVPGTDPSSPDPSASFPPAPGSGAVMYDPTATGSIDWAENGYAVHVVGPYTVSDLEKLAEGITWVGQ